MKFAQMFCVALLLAASTLTAQMKLTGVKGEVAVRHGVSEQWVNAAKGDILKPDDSIRLGKKSSAIIQTDAKNKLQIPEMTVLDISDLRMLTQEELLLRLAMEKVRTVPDQGRDNDFHIPRTTTIHGSNMASAGVVTPSDINAGIMQLNGVRLLYNNNFYATSVLKAKEVFRLVPETANIIGARLMVASALEKMNVNGEALTEYTDLAKASLSQMQRTFVEGKIAQLKKK